MRMTDQQPEDKKTIQDTFDEFDIIDDETDEIVQEKMAASSNSATTKDSWTVLVIDDDEEVHSATEFALKNVEILGKKLKLLSAYSAKEGYQILKDEPQIAVILLDVVMESASAGLELVKQIRQSGRSEVRIILRTGQPGYAPEMSVLRDYDINDYRAKSELTRERLISVLTTSIRSYRQIHTINESRRGLDLIIQSSKDVFKRNSLELFAQGVLIQIIGLLGVKQDGVVCLFSGLKPHIQNDEDLKVITATGRFKPLINRTLDDIPDKNVKKAYLKALKSEHGMHVDTCLGLYFSCSDQCKMFIYIEDGIDIGEEHITLLKVFASNISISFENIALIERLDQLAYIDTDLNLPNRNALIVAYNQIHKQHNSLCLAQVHINAISHAISVFGIPVINKVIQRLYTQIQKALDPEYMAVDNKSNILILFDSKKTDISTIELIFNEHIEVDGFQLLLTGTTSVVNLKDHRDIEKALRHAMSTVTIAKKNPGNNLVRFEESMSSDIKNRVILQSELRKALEKDHTVMTYLQPKVDCSTGKVVGAEALSRWKLNGKNISPEVFIPIAEASGLAGRITDTTLEMLSHFKRTNDRYKTVPVAVNLSIYELRKPNFASTFLTQLADLDLTPDDIEFEITEGVMIKDPHKIVNELWTLREAGYSFAIDDFGTGYSSLKYLEELPINSLKIDKHFINALHKETAQHSIVASAISIAENLHIAVISEGVETLEQYNALLSLGCDACQGYYFGKAVPLKEFYTKFADLVDAS